MNKILTYVSLILLVTGCSGDSQETEVPFTFFVLGDWGRRGSPGQLVVAYQMDEWAKKEHPKFIISTGDNFYSSGVADVLDTHWLESFENVYSADALVRLPWYVVLGNHDYSGNAQAEIDYSSVSSRWHMPSRYFSMIETLPDGGRVRLIFVDSNPFERSYYSSGNPLKEKVSAQDTTRQKVWLDSLTSLADVDWKVVIGHHHIYTGGSRKDQVSSLRSSFEPLFQTNNVDAYLCGHEHDLQHLKISDKPTHYFVSGAGSAIRSTSMIDESLFAAGIQGFMSFTLSKENMLVKVIDYKGNVIYSTSIAK